ncbi:MAG: cyclic nucleotide-binding domain-containing protein [Candidatus Tectomicrobia bacterium]|uniref:Cyclic nucleotide-binding domain-containing protein n=1 Tax=Tectimicrobiota bacterium TaxID=2528274 RepID=A0A933GMI7_UNCTE|nr:cyclic nucleotide-binding domain-containing protein [Candidatus Tectomicrobia bacterium]
MSMEEQSVEKVELFQGLTQEQIQLILDSCRRKSLQPDEVIFQEHDLGDSIWIIESGAVEIYRTIKGEVNKTIILLREGQIFGEMSFLDEGERTANAKTTQPSNLLILSLKDLLKICGKDTTLLTAFYLNLAKILAKRLKLTNEMLKDEVSWNLEAVGAAALNLHRLAENLSEITVLLRENLEVTGRLLQFDNSPAGYNLILKCQDDHIRLIPFHAVISIYVK